MPLWREVTWDEVPVTMTLRYSHRADNTLITASLDAPSQMQFDEECAKYFHENAEKECDAIVTVVNELIERYNEEIREQQASSYTYAEDDGGSYDESRSYRHEQSTAEPEYEEAVGSNADYEQLGLDANATWSEVQAAYRRICKQYHPDTLSSQQLPEHLVELAVAKFKTATDAYQRLRSQMGGQRTAEPTEDSDVVLCPNCGQKNRVGGLAGIYRCGRCGHGISGEPEEAEAEEPYEEPDEYEEEDEDEDEYEDEYEEEAVEPDPGPTVEAFCKLCPTGVVVIRIEGENKAEVEEWFGSAGVECSYCGQYFRFVI